MAEDLGDIPDAGQKLLVGNDVPMFLFFVAQRYGVAALLDGLGKKFL